jgi:hypothetical protein
LLRELYVKYALLLSLMFRSIRTVIEVSSIG